MVSVAWAYQGITSLCMSIRKINVVHTGTCENATFYDANCFPHTQHTPDIAAPYAPHIIDLVTRMNQTLSRDFPNKDYSATLVVMFKYLNHKLI